LVTRLDEFECQDPKVKGQGHHGQILGGGNVEVHCKLMGHCAKTDESIDWHAILDEDSGGPKEPCITCMGVQIPQGEGTVLGFSSPLTMHCNAYAANDVMQQQTGPFRCYGGDGSAR